MFMCLFNYLNLGVHLYDPKFFPSYIVLIYIIISYTSIILYIDLIQD